MIFKFCFKNNFFSVSLPARLPILITLLIPEYGKKISSKRWLWKPSHSTANPGDASSHYGVNNLLFWQLVQSVELSDQWLPAHAAYDHHLEAIENLILGPLAQLNPLWQTLKCVNLRNNLSKPLCSSERWEKSDLFYRTAWRITWVVNSNLH